MKFWKCAACILSTALLTAGLPLPAAAADTYTYMVLEDGTAAVRCEDTSIVNAQIPAKIDGHTVTALLEECFNGCTALESVEIPETVTRIGDYAFHGCEGLDTFTLPAQVEELGSFVFEGCTALTEILVEDGNTTFVSDEGVLYESDLDVLIRYPAARPDAQYRIADACTTIAPWAFTDVSALKTLTMKNVSAIGADAFFCATSLQSVTLSEGLKELIGPSFAYCTNLQSVRLPSTLRTIGDNCFYGCVSLQSIELPDGLAQIGEMAFYGCMQMKEMTVPASVKSIGEMGIGYSIDPETNENTVIEGFEMKTISGSKAFSYAKRNDIAYTATGSKTTGMLILLGIGVLLILGGGFYAVYHSRQKQAAALAAQKAAEKAAAKSERKNKKNNKK